MRAPLARVLGAFGIASALLASAASSRAQGLPEASKRSDDYYDPRLARGFQGLTRPTGIAEVGVGWLTLPGASVCAQHNAGSTCKKGDTSFDPRGLGGVPHESPLRIRRWLTARPDPDDRCAA